MTQRSSSKSSRGRIILGAMSGTSADGVDVAATHIVGCGLNMRAKLLGLATQPFPRPLRQSILHIRSTGRCTLAELANVGHEITLHYAKAAGRITRQLSLQPSDIACIAAHGQTLFHAPPLTIQWFDPALLSVRTGCTVISDFRRADCALGGQGAPLVPFADYLLFRHKTVNRVLLNIGGIANITYLPAGAVPENVVAFDTGPGNCLSDAIAREQLSRDYDPAGRFAGLGQASTKCVTAFLRDHYFTKPWPKSTDGPQMLRIFQSIRATKSLTANDQLATACMCCAATVQRAISALGTVDQIIVAGGGAKNATLMRLLADQTRLPLSTTSELGIPVEAREAMAFALLAAATLDGVPSNIPNVTGARAPAILGSVTRV